jgi:hypothetical protein
MMILSSIGGALGIGTPNFVAFGMGGCGGEGLAMLLMCGRMFNVAVKAGIPPAGAGAAISMQYQPTAFYCDYFFSTASDAVLSSSTNVR